MGEKRIIGIHPGAYYETQRWPVENFSELINKLQNDGKFDVIIFGGLSDRKIIREIESLVNEKITTYIGNDLRFFSSLLSYCNIFICNNSGPLHMAVALNIPTISFMGPTVKEQWMPLGDKHEVLRMDILPCIGCNLGYCKIKTHDCMRQIAPGDVMKLILGSIQIQPVKKEEGHLSWNA